MMDVLSKRTSIRTYFLYRLGFGPCWTESETEYFGQLHGDQLSLLDGNWNIQVLIGLCLYLIHT